MNFFSFHYDHGFQWYLKHFPENPHARAIGEVSPSYFHEPSVPERVKHFLPEAKIIVSLREPISRAMSNHRHEVRIGHLSGEDLSFESGLRNNPCYIEQGLYATHLTRWLQYFSRDKMLVLLVEDIVAEKRQVAKRIYEFLEIDANHLSESLYTQSNPSYVNRYPWLEQFRETARHAVTRVGLGRLWDLARRGGLRELYSRFNKMPSEIVIPPVSQHTIRELRQRFEEEIASLEKILDRPLTGWRCDNEAR